MPSKEYQIVRATCGIGGHTQSYYLSMPNIVRIEVGDPIFKHYRLEDEVVVRVEYTNGRIEELPLSSTVLEWEEVE